MTQNLDELNIHFPDFWNTEKVLKVLTTYDSLDLPEYFMATPTAFTKLMKVVMPDKPSNQSYSKYLKEVLATKADVDLDDEVELGIDRKSIQAKKGQQDKFAAIYKKGSFMSRKDILQLSKEEQAKYASYAESMKQAESYIVDRP